jgi:hypothetical protein
MLGPDGQRLDAQEHPEMACGSVEYIAPQEYMVRALILTAIQHPRGRGAQGRCACCSCRPRMKGASPERVRPQPPVLEQRLRP